jgi:3-oxoacyl-[acyl-carrier protein] reductase
MSDPGNRGCYVVLGASGGIGTAVCEQLAAAGSQVAVASRASDRLDDLADRLNAPKWVIDASEPESIETAVREAAEKFGRLDGVANCIGSVLLKAAHLTSYAEWDETLIANLTSAFAAVRSGVRAMRDSGGSIVLVSTAASLVGIANHEAIAAAKGGINSLVLSAAATYASKGIRVNAVAPGLVKTPMTRMIWERPRSAEASVAMHALGRLGEPDDVASAIRWLLDTGNSWVTGQVLGVDGGLGSVRPRG